MRHHLSLTALLLAAAACGNSRGGSSVTYRLVHADGQKPPVLLRSEGACQTFLLGSDVVFPGDQTYSSSFNIQVACADSVGPGPNLGTTGRVSFRGDTVRFHNQADQVTGWGTLTSDTLRVQSAQRRLVYGRLPK